ncbi:MAG: glycosyl transferase, family 2 [Bryobacterales bacterium]|nr:glycosyl transferase, family 2 [Bryobacterales bacterium]
MELSRTTEPGATDTGTVSERTERRAGPVRGSSKVTVAVPTLAAGEVLEACLRALESQSVDEFEVVVIDNSGSGRVKASSPRVRVIANNHNVGFGAAVNQAFLSSAAPYLATLNDDAVADPRWLETLVADAEAHPRAGMFASEVRLAGTGRLDSAGMLIASDGSSKQRGHEALPALLANAKEALLPSGSAALYRRAMLDEIGLFDESFFLYCEDTDLGLRARWAGWECRYVPGAVVEHRYSHSAGRATPLKAYYVERNRLYTIVKNFPAPMLWGAPFASVARYIWHVAALASGRGKAAEFRQAGYAAALLPFLVIRANLAALFRLPALLAERRRIRAKRRISAAEFRALLQRHSITVRQVAAL